MNTEPDQIVVSGLKVQIVRKPIKNLHLGVYPPNGRVRVAAPLVVADAAVRLAVIGKLGWIKRQQARFEAQPRMSPREFVSGESHYVFGRRHRLRVVPNKGRASIVLRPQTRLELQIHRDASAAQKNRVLQVWYRDQLRARVPALMEKWEPILGVKAAGWGIRKMKTRWGTCHVETQRIWLNLELAKKPVQCLEYILVHELAHLIERTHNERFVAVMNRVLPQWRLCRQKLNSAPLAHESWDY